MIYWIILIVGLVLCWPTFLLMKQRKIGRATIVALVAFCCIVGGFGKAVGSKYNDSSSNSSSSSSSSEKSSSKSSSDDDSLTSSEQRETHQLKMKNIADQLNDQFSQHDETKGFSIKADGSIFRVSVPDDIASDDESEQKEVYRSCSSLVDKAMGQEGQPCYFYDSTGHELAHVTFSGDIKMK